MDQGKVLQISFLGAFRLQYGEKVVTAINSLRMQELFAWLLLHSDVPQTRQHLSFLFWPDSPESQARNNLRNLLHLLRKVLPDSDKYIVADRNTLRWKPDSDYTLDVAEFEKAIAEARQLKDPKEIESKLKEAVSIYGGQLLPDSYTEWIEEYRYRLKQDYQYALEKLVSLYKNSRRYDDAIRYAKMWTTEEPVNESAWRYLIKLYALNNDRANALQSYKKCINILRSELDIEPAPETQDLYDQLVNHYREIEDKHPKGSDLFSDFKWPLIGRDREWSILQERWKSTLSGKTEFLLLEGETGIGKTRLAAEFAEKIKRQGYPVVCIKCRSTSSSLSYGTLISCLKNQPLNDQIARLHTIWKTQLVRLLPELLIENPDLKPPRSVDKPGEQCQLFEAISKAFLAVNKPMLLFFDDLQWCDQETLDWISYHLQNYSSAKLYFIYTLDSEKRNPDSNVEQFIAAHQNEGYQKQIDLSAFDLQHTAELISKVSDEPIDNSMVEDIHNRTDGIPGKIVKLVGNEEVRDYDHSESSTTSTRVGGNNISTNEIPESNSGGDHVTISGKFYDLLFRLKESSRYLYMSVGLILIVLLLLFLERPLGSSENTNSQKSTIGVLSFNNLSGESADDALTMGMVDILSNNLALSDEFRVISHKSISFYNSQYSQIQMAKELGLDFLIEGSVLTSGEQVRINIQLMDAKTSEYIWTKTYESYIGDVFILQKELTEDVLAKVNAVLGHNVEPELAISTERINPDALKYFMQAISTEGEDKLGLLKQSIAVDSTFSPAYAHLAIHYAFRFAFFNTESDRQKSQQAINRALDINPNSSLVYFALGMLSEFSFDWDKAEKAFQKTIEYNPLNEFAHHELAQLLMRLGRFEEAIESGKRAIYLAPNSSHFQSGLGEIYLYQREYEKAIQEMEKALLLNNNYHPTHRWLAKAYMHNQYYQKALEHYDTYSKLHDSFNAPSFFPGGLAQIYGYTGQKERAFDLIDTYLKNNPTDKISTFRMLQLALAYTSLNDVENALIWLEQGQKSNAGWLIYLKVEPGFDSIRNNPRYQAVERQIFGKYSS